MEVVSGCLVCEGSNCDSLEKTTIERRNQRCWVEYLLLVVFLWDLHRRRRHTWELVLLPRPFDVILEPLFKRANHVRDALGKINNGRTIHSNLVIPGCYRLNYS